MLKLKFDKNKAYSLEVIPSSFGPDENRIIPFTGKERDKFFAYLAEISEVIKDRQEIRHLFDACSAQNGYGLIHGIRTYLAEWPQEDEPGKIKNFLDDTAKLKTMLILKNIFNCETHHEITANYLRLLEDKKVKVAEKYIPKYIKYKNADFGS